MSFLKNILEENRFEEQLCSFQEEYNNLFEEFCALVSEHDIQISEDAVEAISEGITDFGPNMSVGEIFDEAQRRFNTAKWAFGLTNKLKNPSDKKKHRRIVITAMNQIRVVMNKLMMQLTREVEDEEPSDNRDPNTIQTQRRMETRPRLAMGQ